MQIGRVEKYIGHPSLNHKQRVTTKMSKGNFVQIGEDIINGKTTYKEVITKGYNYFRRAIMSYNSEGKRIEGSAYQKIIRGEKANKERVRHFGVIA